MANPMKVACPYRDETALWLRGNLHAHTTESDGTCSPDEVITHYANRGYDFLAVTDHDLVTDLHAYSGSRNLTLIHGSEVGGGPHTLTVNIRERIDPRQDRQAIIDSAKDQGGFAILNHPNWGVDFSHWDQPTLESLSGHSGIEIYNAVIDWLEGSSLATDRWDRLLSHGTRCWGFANDDSHRPEGIGRAWIVVDCDDRSTASICRAIQAGRFFSSTGVAIDRIHCGGGRLEIVAPDAQRLRFVSRHGVVRALADGPNAAYRFEGDERYIRVECYGLGDRMAWTQPVFILG